MLQKIIVDRFFYLLLIVVWAPFSLVAQDKPYQGAEIRTNDSYLYGKFEVRMKSAENSGMLCSFFTFYDQPDFSRNWNEIDIEILGRYNNEVQFNTITPGPSGRAAHEKRYVLDYNPHEEFHTYAFVWTPEFISFEVDGQEVYRDTGAHIADMNRPQKLMMNIWISHWTEWTGIWSEPEFPLTAQYDYVKYYAYTPEKEDSLTLSWSDDFNNFNTSRWSMASHSFDGNLVQFNPDNKKFKNGILNIFITKSFKRLEQEESSTEIIQPLKLESGYIKKNKIHLFFSNKLERKSGRNPANYSIEGIEIEKVSFFTNYNSPKEEVIIKVSKEDVVPEVLNVEIKNIKDVHDQVLEDASVKVKKK